MCPQYAIGEKEQAEIMKIVGELSNLQCEKAAVRPKPYKIFDHGGLHLLIAPTGGKLWRWKYRYEGKQKQMAFGGFPVVSLAQARLLHAEARAKLAAGTDPMAERQEAKHELREALAAKKKKTTTEPNFENLARQWFAWWKNDKNQKYIDRVQSRLEGDTIPRLGKMRPEDIQRMDIVNAIKATDNRGSHDSARRNLQTIRQIFTWGQNNGVLDGNSLNPATSIRSEDILSRTVKGHFARISLSELPALIQKMDQNTGYPVTRLAMELMSLTFLRTTELLSGRWKEIDWDQKQWIIPAERMKGRRQEKRAHLVPLSRQSLDAFKRLYELSGSGEYMFPSIGGHASKTICSNIILHTLKRLGYHRTMTGHGWRGLASTYLHEKGFNHLHIETQLSHVSGAGDTVSQAYNYAQYLEPRRQMMQAWADFLDECRNKATRKIPAA